MKISSVNAIIGQYNRIQTDAVQAKPKVQASFDRVELSEEAQLYTEAFAAVRKSMLEAAPDQDVRMQQVMEQMRTGNYSVAVNEICDKLFI